MVMAVRQKANEDILYLFSMSGTFIILYTPLQINVY